MKKKVLFLMETLGGGGAEKVLVNIVNSLDDIKYDITLLLLKREGMYLSKIPPHVKIKYLLDAEPTGLVRRGMVYSLKKRWFNAVLSKSWLANMLFSEEYDVGVSFLEGDSSLLLSHLDGAKKKIAWVHIDLEKHQTLPREVEKEVYQSMDKIICVSEGSKHSVLSLYPALNDITSVIYNPIDIKKIIDGGKQKIRVGSGLNVLAVGRLLNDQKAFDVLLDAHRINISAGLNYHLTILGEGTDRSTLEAYITEHQLGNNTSLLGFKDNPYPYIAGCDIFVISSHYEGYPVVLVEAMTLGKPIVSTECTGPKEALSNGEFGHLVPIANSQALADGLKMLLENDAIRERYAELSKQRSEFFSFERSMRDIETLLNT